MRLMWSGSFVPPPPPPLVTYKHPRFLLVLLSSPFPLEWLTVCSGIRTAPINMTIIYERQEEETRRIITTQVGFICVVCGRLKGRIVLFVGVLPTANININVPLFSPSIASLNIIGSIELLALLFPGCCCCCCSTCSHLSWIIWIFFCFMLH